METNREEAKRKENMMSGECGQACAQVESCWKMRKATDRNVGLLEIVLHHCGQQVCHPNEPELAMWSWGSIGLEIVEQHYTKLIPNVVHDSGNIDNISQRKNGIKKSMNRTIQAYDGEKRERDEAVQCGKRGNGRKGIVFLVCHVFTLTVAARINLR